MTILVASNESQNNSREAVPEGERGGYRNQVLIPEREPLGTLRNAKLLATRQETGTDG